MRELERQQKEVINLCEMCIKKESIPINVIFLTCPNILTIEVQKLFIHDGKIFTLVFHSQFFLYLFAMFYGISFYAINLYEILYQKSVLWYLLLKSFTHDCWVKETKEQKEFMWNCFDKSHWSIMFFSKGEYESVIKSAVWH